LERLKAASALKSRAFTRGPAGSGLATAWVGEDRAAHLAAAKSAADAEEKAAAAAAETARATGIDESLTQPPHVVVAQRARRALLAAARRDDVFDAGVHEAALNEMGPLREWLSPAASAEWARTGALPGARGDSVLAKRARELQTLLDRVAACEDYVFSLSLVGGGYAGGLPSHLELDLVLSRLPNVSRLEVMYGALDRDAAPVRGYAPPLRDEEDAAGGGGDAPPSPPTTPPDAVVVGMLADDLPPLVRGLRGLDSLTTLVLSHNGLGDDLGVALATRLVGCASLTTLDVSHNALGDAALGAFAALLRRDAAGGGGGPALSTLLVAGNSGGAAAGNALAAALAGAPWLVHLDASLNQLGDGGGAAILRAAALHAGLERLALAGVGLGDASVAATVALVSTPHSRLRALDVSVNAWDAAAVGRVADAIVRARETGVGATALAECDVRPAEEPRPMRTALRENKLAAGPGGKYAPLLSAYKNVIMHGTL
jgi:hypothetical protein